MRYIRPAWLTHRGDRKDFEIYSCHISPDGSRLVTAAGDGYVRVWSTEAIQHAADPTYSKPKQLAYMSYHSGTIHVVRFSPSGLYLASGADDKILCVYTLDSNAPSHGATFGTDEPPPTETWRSFRRLIGHDNDVQDLGWSHDASILVSVGLDSKIVVWSGHTFEKLKTISGHQSHVKGITFDPADKYFATASDDRTIKIWRFTSPGPNASAHDQMNNFTLEKTVTAPFVSSPLTTYFRRCSWSPDGNHISAANSVNGPVSAVAIINRGSWGADINLIGHEGPVEVTAFSPRLFRRDDANPGALSSVIACGGHDRALSVWVTTLPRPLLITQEFATKPISDLAWSPDGRTLYVSSLDGSMTVLTFEEEELGQQVSLEEIEKSLAKYGGSKRGGGIVDSTQSLILEEKARHDEMRGVEGRMGALMGHVDLGPATNGINGVSTVGDGTLSNGHVPNPSEGPNVPSANGKESSNPQDAKLEKLKNRVTITKDGKKRIAPLLVSTSGGQESTLPRSQLLGGTAVAQANSADAPQSVLDLSKPFDGLPQGGLTSLLFGNKRGFVPPDDDDEGESAEDKAAYIARNGDVPILSDTPNGLIPANVGRRNEGPQPAPEWIRSAVVNPSLTTSQLRLAVPKLRSKISHKHETSANRSYDKPPPEGTPDDDSSGVVFEARNATSRNQEPCRVAVTRGGQPIWQDYLPRSALLMAGSTHFWAVACEDSSVYTWTPAGRRLSSAIVLESQPVILSAQEQLLLCLTAVGMCYVWNITTQSSPHPPVSLAPVLDASGHTLGSHGQVGPAVTSARLNSEGRMIITLSNGDGFTYSPNLFCWQRISEVWWATGSQYWNNTDTSVGNLRAASKRDADGPQSKVSAGVIPFLERNTTRETLARGRSLHLLRLVKQLLSREGFENFESSISIAHLENRIAAAMTLGAKDDFQVYLHMYAKRIGAEGLKTKVEELLRGILGEALEEDGSNQEFTTLFRDPGDRKWDNPTKNLCGWPRRDLLRSVLLLLGKNRELQRITVPYATALGITGEERVEDEVMSL